MMLKKMYQKPIGACVWRVQMCSQEFCSLSSWLRSVTDRKAWTQLTWKQFWGEKTPLLTFSPCKPGDQDIRCSEIVWHCNCLLKTIYEVLAIRMRLSSTLVQEINIDPCISGSARWSATGFRKKNVVVFICGIISQRSALQQISLENSAVLSGVILFSEVQLWKWGVSGNWLASPCFRYVAYWREMWCICSLNIVQAMCPQ